MNPPRRPGERRASLRHPLRAGAPGGVIRVAVSLLVMASCTARTASHPSGGSRANDQPFRDVVCDLPRSYIRLTAAGYHPARSGDVQFVPVRHDYFGARSHSGPWPFLQRVPLLFYGPGHVPATGRVSTPATLEDVAPTAAAFLDFPFSADGRRLPEVRPRGGRQVRLLVTVVWDGGGRNVLRGHPDAWPVLHRLIGAGVWYERAVVGSSPSVTPAAHTTIGTGVPPQDHGLVDMLFRLGGRIRDVSSIGPGALLVPTLADRYDRANANRPQVGLVGPSYAVGIIGRGAELPGSDRDLAVIQENERWIIPAALRGAFRFPQSIRDLRGPADELEAVDRSDGVLDGRWLNVDLDAEPHRTPAFDAYQVRVLERLIREERFGKDEVPDLLYTNFKLIDFVGHRWGMHSRQMAAAVAANDRALGRLVQLLNREVGRDRWVLILTADHGSMPDATVTGGFPIDGKELVRDLQRRFDGDGDARSAVQQLRVTQVWLDRRELAEHGHDPGDVARALMRYTARENVAEPSDLPAGRRDDRVIAAAFPSTALGNVRCPG
jgi:hypothetical protein